MSDAFQTSVPLNEAKVAKSAPSLLMALIWLYGLELREPDEQRTEDFKQEKLLAMRGAQLAIEAATGMDAA